MQQYQSQWLVVSNLGWLAPAQYAYSAGSVLLTMPSLVVMALSMFFHAKPSLLRERIDTVSALIYVALGPVLLMIPVVRILELLFCLSMVLLAAVVWLRARWHDRVGDIGAYQRWHGIWHLMAALMTLAIYEYFFVGAGL